MKTIHHVCIQTEDYKKSMEFYTQILGFKVVKETENFHARAYNTWLELDGFMIELQTAKAGSTLVNPNSQSEGLVHMCFLVEDVKEEVKEIQSKGYSQFKSKNGKEVYEVEGSFLAKVIAPEGTIIELRDKGEI